MKKQLQKIALLLVVLVLDLAASQPAKAGTTLSADITYTQVAPGTFQVFLRHYRDCNSTPIQNLMLGLNAPGCATSRTVPLTQVSSSVLPGYVCALVSRPPCLNTKTLYTATVTLTPAEQTCSDWLFSWTECCRSGTKNLINSAAANFYTEAFVKIAPNLTNSAPAFSSLEVPVAVALGDSEMIYSLGANDPDCDSLSYELVAPLNGANSPMGYQSFRAPYVTGNLIICPNPVPPYTNPFNSRYALVLGTVPTTLSPVFPVQSLSANWKGRPPVYYPGAPRDSVWAAYSEFKLDSVSGKIRFTPRLFSSGISQPDSSRYAVDVKISEWRKLNGAAVKVGYTRRSIIFEIMDGGNNPTLQGIKANGHPINSGQVITLRPGMPLNLEFRSESNADGCHNYTSASVFTLSSDVASVLPGAVFTADTARRSSGTITWNGTLNCNAIKFFHVIVEDNGCPIIGAQLHTFGIRVSTTAAITGLIPAADPNAGFMAFPNPFSAGIRFVFRLAGSGKQQILIYNSLGQLVDQLEIKGTSERQELSWEKAAGQKSGLYIARLVQNGQPVQTVRFTKAN